MKEYHPYPRSFKGGNCVLIRYFTNSYSCNYALIDQPVYWNLRELDDETVIQS